MSRLVLLGAAEPHLFVLDAIRRGRLRGTDLTLVADLTPEPWPPMVAGLASGRYELGETLPDVPALAAAAGIRRITTRAAGIDAGKRTIHLEDGSEVPWDVLSISLPPEPSRCPGLESSLAGRPGSSVSAIAERLAALAEIPGPHSIVVAGGGMRGIELACAVRRRLATLGRENDRVTIVEREGQLLPEFSARGAAAVERVLDRQRIGIATGTAVVGGEGNSVQLSHGGSMRADLVLWAVTATPAPMLRTSGLEADSAGRVVTDAGLRSVSHPAVLAAGAGARVREGALDHAAGSRQDARAADRRSRPARRDGAALVRALTAALSGDFTSLHRPSRPLATFLDTSDGRALVFGKTATVHSRAALYLKERRDRELLQRLRA
ncbi:MAG TPA: FAD-dependent oxidoreductase [Gemmatimonadales bacterium]|nr:FAD-dependent oxidoreductase [Gemmatimonadales bacterium]